MKPASLHYQRNGSGKDNYIAYNNGGFSMPTTHGYVKRPEGFPQKSIFKDLNMATGRVQRSRPVKSKPIHYHCYGNGRDAYIGANNGGFIPMGEKESK